jgi:hypothetical protein
MSKDPVTRAAYTATVWISRLLRAKRLNLLFK